MSAKTHLFGAGLLLLLTGGVAGAQTPPAPPSPPNGMAQPAQQGMHFPPAPPQATKSQSANPGEERARVVEMPDGSFMIAEPEQNGPPSEADSMEDWGPDHPDRGGMERTHGHHGHRPPMMSKAAHFHFDGPNTRVDVKCSDDESTKACVDEAIELFSKVHQ